MLDRKEDGKNQIRAGTVLLTYSRLVSWNCAENKFDADDECHFEQYCRDNIHEKFGRLVCWINFSAGAELFAKRVCFYANHVKDFRKDKELYEYPEGDISCWANSFANNDTPKQKCVTYYKTISKIWKEVLPQFCCKMDDKDKNLVISSYKLLGASIRNRDAHAYVQDVRESHFYLVERLFVPSFNILLKAYPFASGLISML